MDLKEVFDEYGNIYEKIFNRIYPAKNGTGFPERNLSVNFSKAYEKISEKNEYFSCTWYEFQFGKENNLHIDAVILNENLSEMIIVESKRFSNPASKIREVGEDIDRIHEFADELLSENENEIIRINMKKIKNIYGVILSDIWTENSNKIKLFIEFEDNCFLKNNEEKMNYSNKIKEEMYFIKNFEMDNVKNYHLTSFCWSIKV